MAEKPAIVPVKHRGKYIRPAVKQYQSVEDFMSFEDLKRYLLSTKNSDPAEDNPNNNNQRQQPENSSSDQPKMNTQKDGDQRINRLIKVRHDIDVAFHDQVLGNSHISHQISEYQKQLQRDVLIRHGIQYLSEDDAKFLNSCLSRYSKDKNAFMKSSLSLKLSTTLISVWYDKAVEMYDSRDPKFIQTKDVFLKVQGWKRRTREQMQQERDSVIKQLVRAASTDQKGNANCGETISQLLNKNGDIIYFPPAPEPEQAEPAQPETTIIELLQPALIPMLQAPSTSPDQISVPLIDGSPRSQKPSSSQKSDQNVGISSHQKETYVDSGLETSNQNVPSTSQAVQAMSSDTSYMLPQQPPSLYSPKRENIGDRFRPRSNIFVEEKPPIFDDPCSYIPKHEQPAHQENHFDQINNQQHINEASQNTFAALPIKSEPGVMLEDVKKEPSDVNNYVGYRSLTNEELVKPRPEPEDNYPYAWNQNQRRYGSNLQNEGFQKDNGDMNNAPYNPIYQGDDQNGMPDFTNQKHHLDNLGIPMRENKMFDAGFLDVGQHAPNMAPQFYASPEFTQQPQQLPPQQNQQHSPRGQRKLPEAMTLILPDSQKTDCNDWTEEDCRSWIENLGIENKDDLEYLRGQRFNKFDFLFLVQNEDSRERVFNMPRPVYSALLCSFNKVLNMHNGHC